MKTERNIHRWQFKTNYCQSLNTKRTPETVTYHIKRTHSHKKLFSALVTHTHSHSVPVCNFLHIIKDVLLYSIIKLHKLITKTEKLYESFQFLQYSYYKNSDVPIENSSRIIMSCQQELFRIVSRIEKEVFVLLFDGSINLRTTLLTEVNVLVCKYRVFF